MTRSLITMAALVLTGAAWAQGDAYPNKPIKMVVPYAAGGNADITTRVIARRMAEGGSRSTLRSTTKASLTGKS